MPSRGNSRLPTNGDNSLLFSTLYQRHPCVTALLGNAFTGVSTYFTAWALMWPGQADAAERRVHARRAGHVLAAFAWRLAIEVLRD
jgi:hypothetical protein